MEMYYRVETPKREFHLVVGSDEALINFLGLYFNSHSYQLFHIPKDQVPETETLRYFDKNKKHWDRMSSFLL